MSVLVPRGENWTIERGSMTIGDLIAAGKISLETVVLGELPMTGDGCILCPGASAWRDERPAIFPNGEPAIWEWSVFAIEYNKRKGGNLALGAEQPSSDVLVSDIYSTREAAEKARSEA